MKTMAVRLYGKNDLRLEEFELPPIKNDEILAKIITDSICMSTYKTVIQGKAHKRVPDDVDKNPVIVGHEFCGEIVEVGSALRDKYDTGMKFTVQPALNLKDNPNAAPGYSFRYIGGSATYVIIPREIIENGCLLEYKGDAYFYGSLAEPMSFIIGAFHAVYHTEAGKYVHEMGIKPGGNMAILAGAGPMGLGAIDYAIHTDRKPSRLVVTDIDKARLNRASRLYTAEEAKKNGIDLVYLDTSDVEDPVGALLNITGGEGYDDVFVFAPVKSVLEQGGRILRKDGCLNFFAGPVDHSFTAGVNFYNVHYNATHILGTSGGNTDDMAEALEMMADGKINPASMITHIGGLDCVIETVMKLPEIPGGKKLIYNNISMELTAIDELAEKADRNTLFLRLAEIVEANNGLWCYEAEKYLLENAKPIVL